MYQCHANVCQMQLNTRLDVFLYILSWILIGIEIFFDMQHTHTHNNNTTPPSSIHIHVLIDTGMLFAAFKWARGSCIVVSLEESLYLLEFQFFTFKQQITSLIKLALVKQPAYYIECTRLSLWETHTLCRSFWLLLKHFIQGKQKTPVARQFNCMFVLLKKT